MRNRMVAATGDARVAADALAYVRTEADRLGLNLVTATNGFAGFSASALRAGLALQQTKEIFTGVSEAAVSMRLPAEQTALVFKALEQIAGKGTVSMEELRGQLGDALPGAFEIAAKAMGKSTAEFAKMVANGEVLAGDFLPRFGAAIRKELGGSVDEAAQGAQAAFNRLGNAFFDLKAKMAESGFLDAVTNSVKDLTLALNDPATVEGLKGFASLLGDIVTAATNAAAALGGFYAQANKAIESVGNKAFATVFGKEGSDAIALARKAKANGIPADAQRAIDAIMARGGFKATAGSDTSGLGASLPGNGISATGGYTLGKIVMPPASADAKGEKARLAAAKQAERLREQLSGQVDSMRYGFAGPEDQAAMDVEKQQETLREALAAKAITEQEFRELGLQAEIAYQEQLAEIRQKAWEDDQSALEGFLGLRLQTEEQLRKQSIGSQAKGFRDTIAQAAQHNRVFFAMEKAAALARATLAAYESVVTAYAFGSRIGGPPLGAAFAGVAAAAQAVNISALASTSFNGGGGGGGDFSSGSGGGYGGGGDVGSASVAPQKIMQVTLVGSETAQMSKNQVRDLIDLINDAQRDGSRVQVVNA